MILVTRLAHTISYLGCFLYCALVPISTFLCATIYETITYSSPVLVRGAEVKTIMYLATILAECPFINSIVAIKRGQRLQQYI